jgi:hypothetical protein
MIELSEEEYWRAAGEPDLLRLKWDGRSDADIDVSDQTESRNKERIGGFLHLPGRANPKTQRLAMRRCCMTRMLKGMGQNLRVGQAIESKEDNEQTESRNLSLRVRHDGGLNHKRKVAL